MPQENVPLSEAASTPVRSESMLRGGRPASSLGPFVPVAAIHARPRRVASETAGKGAAARAYFSIGSPFADQSLKPPAIELTFLKPSRCSVCAARSERPPLAQWITTCLSRASANCGLWFA